MSDLPTGIITPEAVVLEFETAGAAARLLSVIIDAFIQVGTLFVVLFAVGFGLSQGGGFGFEWVGIVVMLVFSFLVILGYPAAMETLWNGRTVGQAALGLRVVTVEGGPVRFRHAAIRSVLGLVELWISTGVIAVVAVVLSKRNQRLGDMVAGTLVLRERTGARAPAAMAFLPPPGYVDYASTLDVGRLTETQYGIVRSFLTRVSELDQTARQGLALRLANPIASTMRHSPPPMVSPELFLVCVAAAYQRRAGVDAPAWPAPPTYPMSYGGPPGAYAGPPGYGGPPPSPGYGPGYGAPPGTYRR